MKLRGLIALFLAVLIAVGSLSFAASAYEEELASTEYYNQSKYETQASAAYNESNMGCTYSKSSTTWKVWSPPASSVSVKLYYTGTDNESGAGVYGSFNLTKNNTTGIWSTTQKGDFKNLYYTYIVTINGVTKETQDPYSVAVGANGDRSMVCDLDSTDPDGWDKDSHVYFNNPGEAVVWELHVRDFSISATSGVRDDYKGKFMAFTEGNTTANNEGKISTCIDYLVEHNVNCVQLMPVADFASVDETSSAIQRNWGYDSKNFNVPEGSYSTDPYNGNTRITEFKMLVQALHDRGISVVMDVVYNHTFVLEGSSLSMTCPQYYYRMSSDTDYCNGSGLGNVLASDKKMCQKYISESLQYWVNEYHIDGFRFDLMGCIDTPSMGVFRNNLDKISTKILMYGEPWIGGDNNGITNGITNGNLYTLNARVGAFNQGYADDLKGNHEVTTATAPKGFVQGGTAKTGVINAAQGKSTYLTNAKTSQLINYVDNHDNLCLFDQVMSSNGKLTAGKDDKSLYDKNKSKVNDKSYTNQIRLALTSCLTSQGTPFTLAGDEMCRTKYGDTNSYRTPDNMNAIDWTRAGTFSDVADYYKGLAAIRQAYSGFTQSTAQSVTSVNTTCAMAYQYTNNKSGQWNKVIVALNNTSSAKTVTLSGSWVVVCNGTKAGTASLGNASGSYSVPAFSGVILVDSSSFNNYTPPTTGTMKLTVEHYTRESSSGSYTKNSTETAVYENGMTYRANKDLGLLFDHDFDKFESTSNATYGKAVAGTNVTVKFYYTRQITSNYLNVQFLNSSSGSQIKTPMKYRLKDGAEFFIPAASVQGYELDTTKYPAGTKGVFNASKSLTLKFYYKPLSVNTTKVHYYKTYSGWTGAPLAYAYYTDDNGNIVEPLGAWTAPRSQVSMSADSSMGNNWYVKDIPVAQCYVMFHPYAQTSGKTQEPGAGEQGYNVSGEAWIQNGIVTFNCKVITSYIDLATGKQLKKDASTSYTKVSSSAVYTTKPDTSLGTYITPANASTFYTAGTTNVVYLYEQKVDPTKPTETKPAPTKDYIYGDVDLDGKVTISDVSLIQQHLAKLATLNEIQLEAADVNDDDKVDIVDATIIQQYLAKIIKEGDSRIGQKFKGPGDETTESTSEPTTESTAEPTTETEPETEPPTIDPDVPLADTVDDGTILQAFCWSFSTIRSNLEAIKDAGFTTIQVSPPNEIKEATKGAKMLQSNNKNGWWMFYQPAGFQLNQSTDNALGTKSEFVTMCKEAHDLGMKIIVDSVINHMGTCDNESSITSIDPLDHLTPRAKDFEPEIVNNKLFHTPWAEMKYLETPGVNSRYDSTYDLTRNCTSRLPDLKTEDSRVQSAIYDYLDELITAGADGFRFDAAKHIETESDISSLASQFWNNTLEKVRKNHPEVECYAYGEILNTCGVERPFSMYTKHMDVTDSSSIWAISDAVRGNGGNATPFYPSSNFTSKNTVLWDESHDTYVDGATTSYSVDVRNRIWALTAGRYNISCVYLARPDDATSTSPMNNITMGEGKKTSWANDITAQINKFHNRHIGDGEYCTASSGGRAYIERGDSGVIIVGLGSTKGGSVSLANHKLKKGTYVDQITGAEFSVTASSSGSIKGTVGSSGIAVLEFLSDDDPGPGPGPGPEPGKNYPTMDGCFTVIISNSMGWNNFYFYCWDDSGSEEPWLTPWPGDHMEWCNTNGYGEDQFVAFVPYDHPNFIVNNGEGAQTDDGVITEDTGIYLGDLKENGRYELCFWDINDYDGGS